MCTNTILCDKVCEWLATDPWFSPGTPVSSTNKTDCHDTTEILLEGSHTHNNNNNNTTIYQHGYYPMASLHLDVQ
jgi:hypothetical protein